MSRIVKLTQWFWRRGWKYEKFTEGQRRTTNDRWSAQLSFQNQTCFHFIIIYIYFSKQWIKEIKWLDVEYWIYFTTATGFVIFLTVRSTCDNINESYLRSEINSIFTNKNINFFWLSQFLWFLNMFLQILDTVCNTWRNKCLLFSHCENFDIFTVRKFDIFTLWE